MLTKKDVAAFLNVSTYTVDTLVRNGKLPCYKIGKACRYKEQDIQTYLSEVKLLIPEKASFCTGNVVYKPGMKLV
jgi:excisionase family DNA binding protein